MKPLYLTYTSGAKPWYSMAENLCCQIKELDAGDCFHLCLSEPGRGRSFFPEVYASLYPKITKAIDSRPVIVLDADHKLRKPIIDIFSGDWDIAAVYRCLAVTNYGRHDYNAGMVLLNNRRPNIIRKFWFEWIYRIVAHNYKQKNPQDSLEKQGWSRTWWEDQSALNEIIAPDGTAEFGKIYAKDGYRILPLDWRFYARGKNAYIKHLKGTKKLK